MAYAPVTFVDGVTPLNAAKLNQLEDGVEAAHAGLPPPPAGQDGKWLTVSGGAMVWATAPAGGADLSYDGDWAAGTYQDGDVVVKDGIAYLCVGGPTTTPPDPTLWGAAALARTGLGVGFPASPVDGEEFILVDSIAAATYQWRFRYNAQHTGPYKWEFIGGTPALRAVEANETTSATSPADLATVGPQFAVPRAGEYWAEASAQIAQGNTPHTYAASVHLNSLNANFSTMVRGDGVGWREMVGGITAALPLAAAANIKMQYSTALSTEGFSERRLAVYPTRLA